MEVSLGPPTSVEKMKSFPFKKKEWPDDENKLKMKIKAPGGGVAYSEQMRVLSGKEHPELFLLWLQDYRTKIWTNSNVNWATKLDILLHLISDDASTRSVKAQSPLEEVELQFEQHTNSKIGKLLAV